MTKARFRIVTQGERYRVQRSNAVPFFPFIWRPWRFTDIWGTGVTPSWSSEETALFETHSFAAAREKADEFLEKQDGAIQSQIRARARRREERRKLREQSRQRWRPTSGDPLVDELTSRFR